MDPDLTQQRQHAHAFLDCLPADQLSALCYLWKTMLSPLDRKLALAPLDDEQLTPDEAAAIQAEMATWEGKGAPAPAVPQRLGPCII